MEQWSCGIKCTMVSLFQALNVMYCVIQHSQQHSLNWSLQILCQTITRAQDKTCYTRQREFGSVSTDTSILCTDSHWGHWRILGAARVALQYRAITRIQPGLAIATQLLYIAIYTIKSPIYFVTCFHHPSNKQPSKYKTFTISFKKCKSLIDNTI